jgi:hypothetical protein
MELRDKLDQTVEFPGIKADPKMKLQELLDHLARQYGLTFDINEAAFRAEMVEDVGNKPVAEEPVPKMISVSLDTVLRKIMSRIPSQSGVTYVVRSDAIEITTRAYVIEGDTFLATRICFSPDGKRVVAANERGQARSWDAHTGQEIVPCTDPPPPRQLQALSPDGQRVARIDGGQAIVEPRVLHTGDLFRRRLAEPVGTHLWHLRLAREARASGDAFALAFHLEPLLVTSLTARAARPRDTFPLWAGRPPLTRATGGGPVRARSR